MSRDRTHGVISDSQMPRTTSERKIDGQSPPLHHQSFGVRRAEVKNQLKRATSPSKIPLSSMPIPMPKQVRGMVQVPPAPVKPKAACRVIPTISRTTKRPLVIAAGQASAQGKRPTMEDVHSIHLSIPWQTLAQQSSPLAVSFAAVYDGHCGKHVADISSQLLPASILSQKCFPYDPATALSQAFVSTDRAIYKKIKGREGGSTCSAALLVGNDLFIANLGDARAVLVESGGHGVSLSVDHKPTLASEKMRIEAAGGRVDFGRVSGCLAVSRAFGDFEFKGGSQVLSERHELVVSNVPDVTKVTLTDSCEAVILACDGVWDVLSSETAAEAVYRTLAMEGADKAKAAARAAEGLVQLALSNRTMDNVTVVVLVLHTALS